MKPFLYIMILALVISCGQKKDKQTSEISDTTTQNQNQIDSLSSGSGADTSFNDLSNRFSVTIPAFPDTSLGAVMSLNVAVIPLDSIAAVKIPWCDNQQQLTKETEKEFETELLNCKDGKDRGGESGSETIMKNGYCQRTGYSDAGMGHIAYPYYCSFKKDNNLVVIEIMTRWAACTTGYETEGERKACRDQKENEMKRLDEYITKTIVALKVRRI